MHHILQRSEGDDLHPVTQLTISLLGLIVFPAEKTLEAAITNKPLAALKEWPSWRMSLGEEKCRTLGDLIKRLRNAVAHRHIMFSSDSRVLSEVVVEFEDYRFKSPVPHWRADIRADDLLTFCLRFSDYIESTVG